MMASFSTTFPPTYCSQDRLKNSLKEMIENFQTFRLDFCPSCTYVHTCVISIVKCSHAWLESARVNLLDGESDEQSLGIFREMNDCRLSVSSNFIFLRKRSSSSSSIYICADNFPRLLMQGGTNFKQKKVS